MHRPVIKPTGLRPVLVCAALTAAVSGCGIRAGADTAVKCDNYTFPATTWKNTNYEVRLTKSEIRERRRAAEAVVKCKLVANMPKSRVKAMLGAPHEQHTDSWLYVVGAERALVQVDDENLIVQFRHNRVSRVIDVNVD
jgi:hypothetical protein